MEYSNILNQILILFLVMAVGFVAGKKSIITQEVNYGLSKILINITLPFMIVSSFSFEFSKEMFHTGVTLLIISMVIHLALTVISFVLYRKNSPNIQKVLRFITIFSNCGFIGFPVVGSVFGSEGIFYTAIYNVGFNVFAWTVGVMIFKGKDGRDFKKAIINPGIISVTIGMILFIFSIKLPFAIGETISLIGSMTSPLSMIIVGVSLCTVKFREVFSDLTLYYASFIRLIAIPVTVFFILKMLGFTSMLLGIPVLVCAMPAAANTVTFAQIYNGDVQYASKATVITTILSAFTIPLIILLF
ncbi:MAG: AEC family transporter [Clostridium sp.]|uniref:AEC family transporter n=1 Tax=Clostridium sp. TaxID=1506 RepID=UPI002FC7B816